MAGDFRELDGDLSRLEDVLTCLENNELTQEQVHHLTYTHLPKLVTALLKLEPPTEALCERLNEFFTFVLRTCAEMLRGGHVWEIVDTMRILSDGPNALFYAHTSPVGGGGGGVGGGGGGGGGGGSPSAYGELESNSSAEGSGSELSVDGDGGGGGAAGDLLSSSSRLDECSPYYLNNVYCFHQHGGFAAIIDRIGREPRVPFYGLRILIRPFLKVKGVLSRHNLQTFTRKVYVAVMGHIEGMTDEQLKQEDRKAIGDLTKGLELLLRGARLSDAHRHLEEFSLALSLKCLRARSSRSGCRVSRSSRRSSRSRSVAPNFMPSGVRSAAAAAAAAAAATAFGFRGGAVGGWGWRAGAAARRGSCVLAAAATAAAPGARCGLDPITHAVDDTRRLGQVD